MKPVKNTRGKRIFDMSRDERKIVIVEHGHTTILTITPQGTFKITHVPPPKT